MLMLIIQLTQILLKGRIIHNYLIGYVDKVISPLVLILPKMSRYVKTFSDKNNKLMSFHIGDDKQLEKYKTIWMIIEDLENIELNALPVYDNRDMKTKIRRFDVEVYTNFHGVNVAEDGVECESFTIISIVFFTFLWKQILSASIFRQLSIQSCKPSSDRLSW